MESAPACRLQFSLLALFEYTTLCCILAALTGAMGIGPTICLMFLGLALGTGQGLLSLAMLWASMLAAASPLSAGSNPVMEQMTVILMAAVICGWYRWRSPHATP